MFKKRLLKCEPIDLVLFVIDLTQKLISKNLALQPPNTALD